MPNKKFLQIVLILAVLFASLGFTGSASAAWCGTSYTVKKGDTLSAIARTCGTSLAALRLANPGMGKYIYPGQTLVLPGAYWERGDGYATYVVARGDTLRALANRFGTTMDALASLNGIYNYNLIYEGQRLTVPLTDASPITAPDQRSEIHGAKRRHPAQDRKPPQRDRQRHPRRQPADQERQPDLRRTGDQPARPCLPLHRTVR
ncbi:MAG TPA: LysM peptidoglycan-binding domain-containing protein [Anaerolineales bacterium]|nr:LysM peptidoglycan-binding domain-containing protein [Anaerolineales bacterium]